LPYVYLDEQEYAALLAMAAAGVAVTAQDLPGTTPVSLGALG
jgi:hypothetical protein